ncbi:hypothetical protein CERSUDRAFT_131096 [Gelatoporia subvermispora B]|uniref:Small ribosomal subunit protein bS18m n=1 Tax=Ceriporiopsis subvermispora (strain B) TaxID=914234 RepID=M2RQS5_CERS8|nr:hypothetical protein CERSUDRAFT_131096 [Gelatoporia subvermispora B]
MTMALQHLSPARLLSSPLRTALSLQRHACLSFTTSAARSEEQGYSSTGNMDMLSDMLRSAVPVAEASAASAATVSAARKMRVRTFNSNGDASFLKPQDLSFQGIQTQRRRFPKPYAVGPDRAEAESSDLFHQLEIDPLAECMNSTLLSYYVTKMGRIQSRAETKLTWRNQRRLGKAIRRAKKMGIIPFFSKRPLDYKHRDI